jgi:predicted DsbA family dithiol-disulfide isomerase
LVARKPLIVVLVLCSTKEPVVDVEIWSDVACPWCYVGKRRFEAALEQFEHRDDVNVTCARATEPSAWRRSTA